MRVLLVYPNANREIIAWGDLGAIAEPLSLEYIAAAVRRQGHEARLLDLRLHEAALDGVLRDYQPHLVGVTGYSMHVRRALEVCQRTRQLVPGCRVVAGGHHATLEPSDFFVPQVDFVVNGEGTRPMGALLERLGAGEAVRDVPGVWARHDGEFVYGGETPPFDVNSIPLPDRSVTRGDRHRYFIDWMKPIALVRTTVGCPYRCTFCSLWRIMDGRYYKRDIERVIDELASLEERYVFFVDDEPFVDPGRMWKLAEAIEAAGLDKEYFAYCRVDSFLRDADLMKKWKQIGLRRVLFGIETIFDWELAEYQKRQQRDDIVRALQRAKEIGVAVYCNFIINPDYSDREFDAVEEFVKEHDVDYPSFTILTPIPGTGSSYEEVLDVLPNGRPNWDYFDLQHAVIPTRMPKDAFMRRYAGLYKLTPHYLPVVQSRFGEAFAENRPGTEEICAAIARRVLGMEEPPPAAG
jgi:radical SAM superfamily enzyme YgiQ (UPF0313 family)